MDGRAKELIDQGNGLFSKRSGLLSVWQEVAENFYPERADFMSRFSPGDEYASNLMTGVPVISRRDLANSFSAMLRPHDKLWFHARTSNEAINNDATARAWLEWASNILRLMMYDRRSQFTRATSEGDNDFATFGQCVIMVDPRRDLDGLLFRTRHLRDTVWCENHEWQIDTVHSDWPIEARVMTKLFGGKVAPAVKTMAEKEPYKEVKCRHIIVPSSQYDLKEGRRTPFTSIWVDIDNQTVLEERPAMSVNYVIPRWATVSGSQYAFSPAMTAALPDARLLQKMSLTLLEAGEKTVDPPTVAFSDGGFQGGVNLMAGGFTWADKEYDGSISDLIQQYPIDARGLGWGADREKRVEELISKALYLDTLRVPYMEGDMTATEYRGRAAEYISRALPLFGPVEQEYNGGLCEQSFEQALRMGSFGPVDEMPAILRNQEVRFQFDSPLSSATERAKSEAFVQTANMLKIAAGIEAMPSGSRRDINLSKAFRDALTGVNVPANWIVPQKQADEMRAQDAQAAAMQQAVSQGIDIAGRAGAAMQDVRNAVAA